tara:strand:- start:3307 stop:3753 length:447 start_codon:yes stop_codon:yes gene_type:complete
MVIYRVIHNLTRNTIEELEADCNVSRYAECFATKGEATKYATQIKKALLSYTKEKRQEYKDNDTNDHMTEVSPTKYINGCGFSITVSKVSVKGKAELVKALSSIPLQEFHSYDEDCGTTDHTEVAVFAWDADNATNRNHYGSQDTYEG